MFNPHWLALSSGSIPTGLLLPMKLKGENGPLRLRFALPVVRGNLQRLLLVVFTATPQRRQGSAQQVDVFEVKPIHDVVAICRHGSDVV
jgi:hypothetical protein